MERYAAIIAALKIRTSNKKGRHLSTARAIRLLEEDGVETPEGVVRAPVGLLRRATIDRVLRTSGLDYARVTRPVAAVRFQAKRSNELWQFDMSPSDLKQVEAPLWIEPGRGKPTLMLFRWSMTDRESPTTNIAASMAKMPSLRCASCSTPWLPNRRPSCRSRAFRPQSTWITARSS